MRGHKVIKVFEHDRLYVGREGFKQDHLDALLRLNDIHEGQYFEPIARGIKFNQYVGVIQIDHLLIEIYPKADRDNPEASWQSILLPMLKACGKLKATSTGPAYVRRQHLNLLEIYFDLFLQEVTTLLHAGLIKQYRKETSNTKVLKGKLEFAGNIRQNLIHKERFYTTHQIYDHDHLIHQVLLKALQIVDQFSKGTQLYDACKRVLIKLPEISERPITAQHCNQITLTRKSKPYAYALELARLIILNYSPDISSGRKRMLSLLFDMNQLWEEYILIQVRKACQDSDIIISGQESKKFWGYNSLRPDIVLRKGGRTYIIDTKWKHTNKLGASVQDLRQMYAYCRFWNAESAMLLYPGKEESKNFIKYQTKDFSDSNGTIDEITHRCKMGYVSVLNPQSSELDLDIGYRVLELMELNSRTKYG